MSLELQYLIVYVEIILLCVIITSIVYYNINYDLGSEREVNTFRMMIIVYIIAVLMDAVTHAQYRHAIHIAPVIIAFFYSSYMFLLSGVQPFLWFKFAESKLGYPVSRKDKRYYIALLPVLVIGFMNYLSPVTGWFFSLDENGIYTRGPLWGIQSLTAYLFFIYTTIHALIVARRET